MSRAPIHIEHSSTLRQRGSRCVAVTGRASVGIALYARNDICGNSTPRLTQAMRRPGGNHNAPQAFYLIATALGGEA